MAGSLPYSAETAKALLALVDIAGGDLSYPSLPSNLSLKATFALTDKASGGLQGFWATGIVPGFESPVAVLAVAAAWPAFTGFFRLPFLTELTPSPAYLNLAGGGKIALGYSSLYGKAREPIWEGLKKVVPAFVGAFPILVVGMGPGGPLAQFAALDLRPGQTGPGGSPATSPASAIAGYTFSTPAYGDAAFAGVIGAALDSVYLCNIPDRDFYPSAPGPARGFVPSGAAQTLSAPLPSRDVPWLERTPAYYLTAYGGRTPSLPGGGTIVAPPPGFDADLAYVLSLLSTAAYGRFQHPELPHAPPAGYTLVSDITVNGVVWGAIYTTLGRTVAAIRGPVSWLEQLEFWGDGGTIPLDPFKGGAILTGLAAFYPAFATALFAALAKVTGGGALTFTGHDFGGALAVLAGLDSKLAPRSGLPAIAAIYGFGTVRFGDFGFVLDTYQPVVPISFQMLRPMDVIARIPGMALLQSLPHAIELLGAPFSDANSTTGHTLALYASLLDPSSESGRAVTTRSRNAAELGFLPASHPVPEADISRRAPPFLLRMARFLGIDHRHLTATGLDTAAHGGVVVLSPAAAENPLPIVKAVVGGGVYFAGEDITVRAGHRLRIESPDWLPVMIVARAIILEAGAVLELTTPTRIIADRFEGAGTEPNILVIGTNGRTGQPGGDGRGTSNPGGRGELGQNGWITSTFEFSVQELKGRFLAETRGGHGGEGGRGGNGATGGRIMRGGDGGPGGNGGNACDGCRITVRYGVLAQDAAFSLISEVARRGAGGEGGKGGFGGVEGFGSDGPRGDDGRAGTPSSLETIPIG